MRDSCHQVEHISADSQASPHALEHLAALAIIVCGALVGLLIGTAIGVTRIGIEMLARRLLDLQFFHGYARRFESGAKLAEAVAEKSCGLVVGSLEGGSHDAVADIDLHIE